MNQFERRDEKPRHQGQFFQNLDNFIFKCLPEAFDKYTLLYIKL